MHIDFHTDSISTTAPQRKGHGVEADLWGSGRREGVLVFARRQQGCWQWLWLLWCVCVCACVSRWFMGSPDRVVVVVLLLFLLVLYHLWSFPPSLQVSKVGWPDLHLGELYWVLMAFPVEPVHALERRWTNGVSKNRSCYRLIQQAHIYWTLQETPTYVQCLHFWPGQSHSCCGPLMRSNLFLRKILWCLNPWSTMAGILTSSLNYEITGTLVKLPRTQWKIIRIFSRVNGSPPKTL